MTAEEYSKGFETGLIAGRSFERERAIQIIEEETRHYGKTHYEGMDCSTCHIQQAIRGEEE